MSDIAEATDLLTNSRLKTARACARLHQLRYVEGWQAVLEAAALHFGTLIHAGLEAWWLAPEDRLHTALAALQGESDLFDLVKAEELLRGYHFRWGDEPLEIIAVEQPFAAPMLNPETGSPSRTWRLGGKLDGVVRDAGRTLIMEHKTSSEDISPGSAYWKRLKMDGQISIYYRGAESLGYDVQGCLYDVIGKPTMKPYRATPVEDRKYTQARYKACPECKRKKDPQPAPHKVEVHEGQTPVECQPDPTDPSLSRVLCTDVGGKLYANLRERDETPEEFRARLRNDIANHPEAYYQRGIVVRLESEMLDAMQDIWQTGRSIRENQVANRAPRNPDACFQYHRPCQFFEVCSGSESLENPAAFKRLPVVHPELAGVEPVRRPKEEAASCSSHQ